jgi:hypothetical protein
MKLIDGNEEVMYKVFIIALAGLIFKDDFSS